MARYTRRAQVLLSEDQHQSLQTLTEAMTSPLSTLLREAAEEVYFRERRRGQKARAARELLSLPGTEIPEDYHDWECRYLEDRFGDHG
jgi:hypothetical protein